MTKQLSKAAVIGGSGFIGSHVADELSRLGYGVRIFDREDSPWREPNQEFISGDIKDSALLREVMEGCDVVYHFAGLSSLDDGQDMAMESALENIIGTINVLEACKKAGGMRFMYASTLYVYGQEGGFYRCSKLAAEEYIREYSRKYNFPHTLIRYGSLYGPRSDEKNGLYSIVRHALSSSEILYSGGEDAIREYIHVQDAARASVELLDKKYSGQSVILTGQEMMRVKDVLEALSEILGPPYKPVRFLGNQAGHYLRTPYAYRPERAHKYVLPLHVDIGQGLVDLIEQIHCENPD